MKSGSLNNIHGLALPAYVLPLVLDHLDTTWPDHCSLKRDQFQHVFYPHLPNTWGCLCKIPAPPKSRIQSDRQVTQPNDHGGIKTNTWVAIKRTRVLKRRPRGIDAHVHKLLLSRFRLRINQLLDHLALRGKIGSEESDGGQGMREFLRTCGLLTWARRAARSRRSR